MVTEPNMVPMIDVLLVLLIIFLLAAMEMVRRTYDLQLPDQRTTGGGDAPLVFSVHAGPQYKINGRSLPADALVAELTRLFAQRPEKILYVNADRTLRYQAVAEVFDAVRSAGVAVTAILPPAARRGSGIGPGRGL